MQARKIIMADDDADDRAIVQDAMELLDAGDVMTFTENGEELLDLLQRSFTELTCPSLIVLDLNMPKMNGTQTLSRLKADKNFKDIPVIIYSTSINPLEKQKCLSLGADHFFDKSTEYESLLKTLEKYRN